MILLFFELVSSLHIKSVLYPVNEVPNIEEIAEIFGCRQTQYFGLPLGAKSKLLQSGMISWQNVKRSYVGKGHTSLLVED